MDDFTFIVGEHSRELENHGIGFEFFADKVNAIESKWRLIGNEAVIIIGRSLMIENPGLFLQKMGIKSRLEFEDAMQDLADRNLLTIDYLQRRCERFSLRYTISGDRLHTAWRKYLKEHPGLPSSETITFEDEFMEFYKNFDISQNRDIEKAIEWGIKAAELKIAEGRNLLAILLHHDKITDSRQRIKILNALG